jgi:hypothetical protein
VDKVCHFSSYCQDEGKSSFMTPPVLIRKPTVDWLTVVAIAAISMSINVAFHEAVHALTCLAVGGELQEYSALHASCETTIESQAKVVAGSAPTWNLIVGLLTWFILRNSKQRTSEFWYFLWLFMLMNWFYGAGYLIFSGIFNIGDWAVVIDSWEPDWFWRVLLIILGTLFYIVFIRLGLNEFCKVIGGEGDEQIQRANKLSFLPYFSSISVILLAGFFCPYGLLSFHVTASLFGVIGALSPFLWMMRWFRTAKFVKLVKEPFEIHRKWHWLVAAVIVVFIYACMLGRTLYF